MESDPALKKGLLHYLLKDEMPIWLSLLFAISAGLGTYFLAPIINQEFEYQNNKVQHVSKTVGEMNDIIISLAKNVRKFNEDLFHRRALEKSREEALDKVTELQWRLIDASTIIGREGGDVNSVELLQKELKNLNNAIRNATVPEDQEQIIEAMMSCSQRSELVLRDLYKAARLTS